MKIPILGITVDERFLMHRVRSTSIGGMAGILLAGGLFFYHLVTERIVSWELFAIVATAAIVKMSVLAWYRIND